MKTGFNKIWLAIVLLAFTLPAFAVGSIIAATVFNLAVGSITYAVVAFAINMVVSTVISKALFSPNQPSFGSGAGESPNPGNRQQVPPATDNKVPVVYGYAFVGGIITDLIISNNNQTLLYCLTLSEVTNTNEGQTPDAISFGDIYYAGKRVFFEPDGHTVDFLLDDSTGVADTSVKGKIKIYLYSNGCATPYNSTLTANQVTVNVGGTYSWNGDVQMTNCAFALIVLTYSVSANIRGISQTKFEVINSRYMTGDCIYDYLVNTRYGAALPASQIDTASLADLTAYSNQAITYTTYSGETATKNRFQFNGTVDTTRTIMANLQDMASCSDSLIRYNEITGKWGVIVQKPTYTVAMDLNDSNIVSAISITPLDLSSSYNVIEVKFPDDTNQDAFNAVTFDLAQIEPDLLFPNEPVNKQSVALPFTNNDITAQLIAIRMLKSAREDLQLQFSIGFTGLQLEAGDIVTVTNANYGWNLKPFRIVKLTQSFKDDGQILVNLTVTEFNSQVYDDGSITSFVPSDNTSIGSPSTFGILYVPEIQSQYPTAVTPYFNVQVQTAPNGITQYAELWYSAYENPTDTQIMFLGTSEIQSNGTPWLPSTILPLIQVTEIPSGTWYFFVRMMNSLGSSPFSSASLPFIWQPRTFSYSQQFLGVAYADDEIGTGFSLIPTNKLYYGIRSQADTTISTDAGDYTWYLADPSFGTNKYLIYRSNSARKASFATGFAANAAGTGAFVPTQANLFDPTTWSALNIGFNTIDLDLRTGQLLSTGTTTTGTGELIINNTPDGQIITSLNPFLNFGTGIFTFTTSPSTITIDRYGRVIGFVAPDDFFFTKQYFTATAGQTVFTPVPRQADYINGQDWVFRNGVMLKPTTDYTETVSAVTMNTGVEAGDVITIISYRSRVGVLSTYPSFTRNYATLTNATSYTASGFTLNSGYELLFLNGVALTDQDYDILGQSIVNFPNTVNGELLVLQWSANNLGLPNGNPINVAINTIEGQSTYPFNFDVSAFNLYRNGLLLELTADYTTATLEYTLNNVPLTTATVLLQQTFARTGSA
jgi:hypothetical protein